MRDTEISASQLEAHDQEEYDLLRIATARMVSCLETAVILKLF